ncbi:uncharacterized protein LAJ45_00072 [Morchella importuna]|uniref:uncharacterized protein n=1 Tax=Morchella importuna TaxID=1174673 RepID=UPI001E8DA679|nr:uncharacterized protein LAJ45_00072 [Morchella importuna]KAH8155063.1 hypothetical protein LAJ45_00072 [Morchella importuna]
MCQSISTLTSIDATSVPLEVKDYVQRDPSFAANVNQTSFDAAEGFQRDPFCTFIGAIPASFIIKEATQVEMGFLYPIVPFLDFDPIIKTVPVPGVKCPTCELAGVESWVIRGKVCSKCGTPCQ